ncbi:ABC transporter ATP-binding protein [Psychrilyobacter sp.]|uniref:ABC transporter ATP-binding protein n=1 Tax=Psychrilyobacter sp. TaxID=2586924 RepID=UPI0030160AF4
MKELKSFIKYYKYYLKLLIFTLTCAILLALLDLVFPKIIQIVIDKIIPGKDLKTFYYISGGLIVMYLLRYVVSYFQLYYGNILGIKIETQMRKELFTHIQKLSFSYFDNNKTGVIMSKLVNDLGEISQLANHGPVDLFIAIIRLLGAFILMITLNVKLTLVIFSVLPFMIYFSVTQKWKMKLAFMKTRKKIAGINSCAEESIGGVRIVKLFNNENYEIDKFEKKNQEFQEAKKETYKTTAVFFSGIHIFMNLMQFIVVFYGGYLIMHGELTYGILISFLLYSYRFMEPIRKMMILVQSYQKGMAGYRRFQEMMGIIPEIEDIENPIILGEIKGDIELKDVNFSYNKLSEELDENSPLILNEFNLKIKSGENIAIVGSSGVGKSTISNLIPRFYDINSGSITIDGIEISDIKLSSLRGNIGIVPQEAFLFGGTIGENIRYGRLDATRDELIEASKKANIYEFINDLPKGLDTLVGERGVKLSGGQKQRISIARVFLKNPKILILDEATASLDNITEKLIQEALMKLSKDRTTITIAHRLSTIINSDRIVVMDKEGVVETGTHEELLKLKGSYAKLYR